MNSLASLLRDSAWNYGLSVYSFEKDGPTSGFRSVSFGTQGVLYPKSGGRWISTPWADIREYSYSIPLLSLDPVSVYSTMRAQTLRSRCRCLMNWIFLNSSSSHTLQRTTCIACSRVVMTMRRCDLSTESLCESRGKDMY